MALKASGSYTQSTGTIEFSNAGGLSFGLATNGVLTGTHNGFYSSSQLSSTFAVISHTHNPNSLNFADSNNIFWGANTAGSSTTITAIYSGSSLFVQDSEAGNIYFQNAGGLAWTSASGSGTAGFSTSIGGSLTSIGTVQFADSNGVSWGSSVGTGASSMSTTITASVGRMFSNFRHPDNCDIINYSNVTNGLMLIKHASVPLNVTASAARFIVGIVELTNTSVTTASVNLSIKFGIYSRTGSTLTLLSSGSANNGFRWYQSNSTGSNATIISGPREITVPINVNMSAGEYWFGLNFNSATTYTGISFWPYVGSFGTVITYSPISATTIKETVPYLGYYTASTTALPSSIISSNVDYTGATANVQRAANFYHELYNIDY